MIFDEIQQNIQIKYPPYSTLPWWIRLILWAFGKEKEIFELYNTEHGEIDIWYSIVDYQGKTFFKKFGRIAEGPKKMKFTKVKERQIEIPVSAHEAEKIRSEAQELQLQNSQYFAKIQENNSKIEILLNNLSHNTVSKNMKVIEEYDMELKMVTTFFNGNAIETRPMTMDEINDATKGMQNKTAQVAPSQIETPKEDPQDYAYDLIDPDLDDMSIL